MCNEKFSGESLKTKSKVFKGLSRKKMEKILKSEQETKEFARDILENLNGKNVILLFGDLGTGKTTFTQGLAVALGITERVVSPTFTISRVYQIKLGKFTQLVHFDLYRMATIKDVLDLGIMEYINDPKSLVVIEWPEVVEKYVDVGKKITLKFSYGEDNTRIVFTGESLKTEFKVFKGLSRKEKSDNSN